MKTPGQEWEAAEIEGKEKRDEKEVFIFSPFRGDETKNSIKAAGYCRKAYEEGYLPFAPHLFFPQFLNEGSLAERADGIAMGMTFLKECDEIWVFGKPTDGMKQEIKFATEQGVPVYFKEVAETADGI